MAVSLVIAYNRVIEDTYKKPALVPRAAAKAKIKKIFKKQKPVKDTSTPKPKVVEDNQPPIQTFQKLGRGGRSGR